MKNKKTQYQAPGTVWDPPGRPLDQPGMPNTGKDLKLSDIAKMYGAYTAVPPKPVQKNTPCKTCPFRVTAKKFVEDPQALGGEFGPEVFLGQAHGPFVLPCHKEYGKAGGKFAASQPGGGHECAGAAIYRSNVDAKLPSELLRLPEDKQAVFNNPEQFLAHHMNWTPEEAKDFLDSWTIEKLTKMEVDRAMTPITIEETIQRMAFYSKKSKFAGVTGQSSGSWRNVTVDPKELKSADITDPTFIFGENDFPTVEEMRRKNLITP